MSGSAHTPPAGCASCTPASGTFAMHGRAVDVITDTLSNSELVLQNFRAREYSPKLGRWLQPDPKGYVDGPNLYEAFKGNALVNLDPDGEGIITWIMAGTYDASDWEYIKDGGPLWAAGGFFQGGGRTVAAAAHELYLIPSGSSSVQLRLVYLVDSEYKYGSKDTVNMMTSAVMVGLTDFTGVSNLDTAARGTTVVFTKDGAAYEVSVSGFERVQAGVAGVGQLAGTVGGAGGGISPQSRLQLARLGLRAAGELAPATNTSRVLLFRAGLAIEGAQYGLETAAAAQNTATVLFVTGDSAVTWASNVVHEPLEVLGNRLGRLGYDEINHVRIIDAVQSGEQIVIVGENMKRVNAVARMVEDAGGRPVTYKPRNFAGVTRNSLEADRSWFRYWAKVKGVPVIDLGRQPTVRRYGPSPFYGIENRSMHHWDIYTPFADE